MYICTVKIIKFSRIIKVKDTNVTFETSLQEQISSSDSFKLRVDRSYTWFEYFAIEFYDRGKKFNWSNIILSSLRSTFEFGEKTSSLSWRDINGKLLYGEIHEFFREELFAHIPDCSPKENRDRAGDQGGFENHWSRLIIVVTTPRAPINLNFYGANTFH